MVKIENDDPLHSILILYGWIAIEKHYHLLAFYDAKRFSQAEVYQHLTNLRFLYTLMGTLQKHNHISDSLINATARLKF